MISNKFIVFLVSSVVFGVSVMHINFESKVTNSGYSGQV